MTPFDGDSLLISLPGAEIQDMALSGSIVTPGEILANPMSLASRLAMQLLCDHARRQLIAVQCIARPELFTSSLAVAWLRERVSSDPHHVCLSNGRTVKHLEDIPTHVFFHCRSHPEHLIALRDLCRRVPELGLAVSSQINSCLFFGDGPTVREPPPNFLVRTSPLTGKPSPLLPFFLNADSVDDSLNRIEQSGLFDNESLPEVTDVVYLALSEWALHERACARQMLGLIQSAFFKPNVLLILRLASASNSVTSLRDGLEAIRTALQASGMIFPRVIPGNVLLTCEDIAEDHVLFERFPRHVVVHESFEFWRHTPEFYDHSKSVSIIAGTCKKIRGSLLPCDVRVAFGERAIMRRSSEAALGSEHAGTGPLGIA